MSTEIGPQGLSPNPIQRLLVDWPILAPFVQSLFLVSPLLLFVASPGRPWLALQLFGAGLVLLFLRYWVRPARKMSRAERWNAEGVIFPWPKGWPGWRDPESLTTES